MSDIEELRRKRMEQLQQQAAQQAAQQQSPEIAEQEKRRRELEAQKKQVIIFGCGPQLFFHFFLFFHSFSFSRIYFTHSSTPPIHIPYQIYGRKIKKLSIIGIISILWVKYGSLNTVCQKR